MFTLTTFFDIIIVREGDVMTLSEIIETSDIFTDEKCPDMLEVTLSYTGTEDLVKDPVPPMYWGDKISDMYVITLASKV